MTTAAVTAEHASLVNSRTVDAARQVSNKVGVTRAVPITAFDEIGVPVWTTVRPASRYLVVNGGKGLDDDAAEISARLESLEQAVAEQPPLAAEELTLAEAADADPLAPHYERVPLTATVGHARKDGCYWVPVTYLRDGRAGLAPAESVHFPAVPGMPGLLSMSTTRGLACGTSFEKAVVHGVLEVLERHIASLIRVSALPSVRVEFAANQRGTTDSWSTSLALCGRVRSVQVEPVVRVASYGPFWFAAALLADPCRPEARFQSSGYGAHLDPAHAVEAAMLEAIQARATWIHGTRDDLPDKSPDASQFGAVDSAAVRAAFRAGPAIDLSELSSSRQKVASLDDVLDGVSGLGLEAAVHRFRVDTAPFEVVRVVIPGAEDLSHHQPYVGRRLVRAVQTGAIE